jgi:hypothetical protein
MALWVTGPDGREVEVAVPEGVGPGDEFELEIAGAGDAEPEPEQPEGEDEGKKHGEEDSSPTPLDELKDRIDLAIGSPDGDMVRQTLLDAAQWADPSELGGAFARLQEYAGEHHPHQPDEEGDEEEAADTVPDALPEPQPAAPAQQQHPPPNKRRYSISLGSGELASVIQTIDVDAAPEEGGEAEDQAAVQTTLLVVCPEGVEAGMALWVTGPDGREVEVAVPEGVGPGDEFELEIAGAGDAAAEPEPEPEQPGPEGEDEEAAGPRAVTSTQPPPLTGSEEVEVDEAMGGPSSSQAQHQAEDEDDDGVVGDLEAELAALMAAGDD